MTVHSWRAGADSGLVAGHPGRREEPATRGEMIGCCFFKSVAPASRIPRIEGENRARNRCCARWSLQPRFSCRSVQSLLPSPQCDRPQGQNYDQARRRTFSACCSQAAISARFLLELKQVRGRRITKASSNLWPSPRTYQCWEFQRPMPKRTPPSDDIPLARRCAFGAQPEAYQPAGNGISGQTE